MSVVHRSMNLHLIIMLPLCATVETIRIMRDSLIDHVGFVVVNVFSSFNLFADFFIISLYRLNYQSMVRDLFASGFNG